MLKDKNKLIALIKSKTVHPMKMKELANSLGIKAVDYPKIRHMIKQLIDEGKLVMLKRGRIGVASEMDIVIGKLSITRSGVGYLLMDDQKDIFIPHTRLDTAFDGDKVMVRLTGRETERPSGVVIKIMERLARNIVGIYQKRGQYSWVEPDNKKLHRDLLIPDDKSNNAKEGQKVVAVLTHWDDPYLNPEGEITEVIGYPDQAGVDIKTIIKSYNFPEQFDDNIISEAEQASAKITDEEIARREDFTGEDIYTIDPFDAKDHDDAITVTKIEAGYRLGVHIADVSYYVDEKSELNKEAFQRGNSVYLPGLVIPMLPEVLSNDICSLKPDRLRLTFAVIMDCDKSGKLLKWRLADGVIKSKVKLSYEEVQEFFDTGEESPKIKKVAGNLKTARILAQLLNKQRFKNGSLDFDLPESNIVLNKEGEVIEMSNKVRLEAHRLVEEFMLLANQAVALEVFGNAQPFIYRVHDRPNIEKLTDFSAMMKRLGYKFAVSPKIKPVKIARFLDEVKDKPNADFINEMLLRSMQKAVYQRESIGHFGLAFNHYTHFTSPIRRYADLLVHRLLRKMKNGRYPAAFAKKASLIIDRAGTHCSETERYAEAAEREAIKVKQMSFMAKHVGEEFDGVISGVMSFGFFVRLDNLGAEGMVRMSVIDDDYYHYDEKQFRIVGSRTKKVYQLGGRVRVVVLRADKQRSEMELGLVIKKEKKKSKNKKRYRR